MNANPTVAIIIHPDEQGPTCAQGEIAASKSCALTTATGEIGVVVLKNGNTYIVAGRDWIEIKPS